MKLFLALSTTILLFLFSFPIYGQVAPPDTLYNQTLTPSGGLQTSSHFFQNGFPTTYSCNSADDFICTQQWKITEVLAIGGFYNGSQFPQTFYISIYADNNPNGDLPGTEIYNYYNTVEVNGSEFTIPITEGITLQPGHYWISVYASVATDYATWGWKPSTGPYNYEAVWENPGDGFGTGYTSWTLITTVFNGTVETDYSFALLGIKGMPASNPDPENNALDVDLNKDISWTNPASSDSIEVFFGTTPDNLSSIYYGVPITSMDVGMLDYSTKYYWAVVEINQNGRSSGILWNFTTSADPSLPLYADFEESGFPPAGWSFEANNENWWYKTIYSSFGIGDSCALQSFYSAPIGNISSLITKIFPATQADDSLSFDYAYASDLAGSIDQLEILYSVDSGATWTSLVLLNGGMNGELVTASPGGFFVPDSDQWDSLKFELPMGTNRLKFSGISAHGNNLFMDRIKIDRSIPLGIKDKQVSKRYSLSQNYPNPFNPTTTIEYSVSKGEIVTLKVYNILGQEVKTLVNSYTKPGTYKINFDASDLSSGIYYYRLSSGTYSSVMKMTVLK